MSYNRVKVMNKIKEVVELANSIYNLNLKPEVDFTLKGTKTGVASHHPLNGKTAININPSAFNVEGGMDHIINNTVPHEVAHLVCFKVRPRERGHGRIWRSVAKTLGMQEVKRCHNLDLKPTKTVRKWLYVLDCGKEVILKTNRHNKVIKGASYIVGGTKKLNSSHFVGEVK